MREQRQGFEVKVGMHRVFVLSPFFCCSCGKCCHCICQSLWEAVKQEGKLCDDVETVREYTCLGDKVRAGGRCKAAVIARTRFWWIRLRECGELLYYRRFFLKAELGCS